MGFTKLDEGILKSSIMAESPATFKVWIALLASCGYDGVARVSSVFLAAACHLSQTLIDRALEILSSPDPRSRTEADEGRRIRRVDGGYFVINYDKYRAFSYSDNPESVRKRHYRERVKEGDALGHPGTCPGHSASAFASIDTKNLKEVMQTWNDFAAKWQLPTIRDIDRGSKRERHLLRRMQEKDFDFSVLLQKIERQPFLLGKNPNVWAITFDWIILPSNYTKIMEEQYPARHARNGKLDDPQVGSEAHFAAAKVRTKTPDDIPESYQRAKAAALKDKA